MVGLAVHAYVMLIALRDAHAVIPREALEAGERSPPIAIWQRITYTQV
jgi:hypothetical protein